MDETVKARRGGETATHRELKRLSLLWAQAQGYSACAFEVTLPRCRYRADVAAFRFLPNEFGCTAVFECKQASPDLRRDNRCAATTRERLETVQKRRLIIEKHLRVHYPALRRGESLFAEWDSHDFGAIGHRNYSRIVRELTALQNQLRDGTKFEKLVYYRCANLFFLVVPNELFRFSEIPVGWGALVEKNGALSLACQPTWHQTQQANQIQFLHRIAVTGMRQLNRKLGISFEDVATAQTQMAFTSDQREDFDRSFPSVEATPAKKE
jgi:hypothetical protein